MLRRLDWISILIFILLVSIGWLNIYSSTFTESGSSIFDLSQLYGKQILFIGISLVSILLIMALEASFYERFSSVFYIITLLLLLGLFPFGKTIAGATSWYGLGFFNLQPSELAKAATALALAKYLSDIQTDIKRRKDQLIALSIFILPALLIIPQPDPGSALVFFDKQSPLFAGSQLQGQALGKSLAGATFLHATGDFVDTVLLDRQRDPKSCAFMIRDHWRSV